MIHCSYGIFYCLLLFNSCLYFSLLIIAGTSQICSFLFLVVADEISCRFLCILWYEKKQVKAISSIHVHLVFWLNKYLEVLRKRILCLSPVFSNVEGTVTPDICKMCTHACVELSTSSFLSKIVAQWFEVVIKVVPNIWTLRDMGLWSVSFRYTKTDVICEC